LAYLAEEADKDCCNKVTGQKRNLSIIQREDVPSKGVPLRRLKSLYAALVMLAFQVFPGVAAEDKLSITISRPINGYMSLFLGNGRYVYLDGIIDRQAPSRLENFLKSNEIQYNSSVVLNSAGGNLISGIEIGRIIRKYGLSTVVGVKDAQPEYDSIKSGICMSACTAAFLGGKFRTLGGGSKFGVHRFAFQARGDGDADAAQMLSAIVTKYMKEMDIDVELFRLWTLAGSTEILELDSGQLENLNVVNNGFERPKWTIEGNNNLIYLKGERDTIYGINKFIIYCTPASVPLLHIIFDPQGRADEVMQHKQNDLIIDSEHIKVTAVKKEITNGWFNAIYRLNNKLIRAISLAKSVGMIVRPTSEAPNFLGFNHLPVSGGEQKIRSYLSGCRAN
jgi:hypothetical protein